MELWTPIWTSLRVGIAATLIAFPLGLLVAHLLLRLRPRASRWMEAVLLLPLLLSGPAMGILILLLLSSSQATPLLAEGLKAPLVADSESLAILAALLHALPFAGLLCFWVLRGLPLESMRLAAVLGLSPWQSFWRITAPLCGSSLGAIALLCLARAIAEYGIFVQYQSAHPSHATHPGHALPLQAALSASLQSGGGHSLAWLAASLSLTLVLLLAAYALRRGGRLL
jgi:molybdate transport system permease protein